MKPIPYGRQQITQEDITAVVETLQSDFLTQGPKIVEFEKKFAEYIGSRYAVAVANGTAALHLSALAVGVNQKSNVLTTPITFAASANCIRYCGGTVNFVDINPRTLLLDLDLLENKLNAAPRGTYHGIVAVDFAGMPVNLERLKEIADRYQLWVIEDACHAPGGYFTDSHGVKQLCGNGKFTELAIFSFHPVKHIACGEGGMITTNDKFLYEKLLLLRTHGITKDEKLLRENHGGWYYEMQELGFNYRLTDFQAALGISQLSRAEEGLKRRIQIAEKYNYSLSHLPLKTFPPCKPALHAYHLYIIHTAKRKQLYDYLRTRQIYAQVHYIPVHKQPYYRSLEIAHNIFPEAEKYYDGCLSLPMYPSLTDEEQEYVITVIKNFFNE
jgi:UDP-4-amino-4,6-dideoxy-N-acetyl-beta-L-altrosamine transaminase